MKMWVAKTFHLLELVRNFDRYKRLILASLMSAVLIISIIFLGSFLPTGQSVSSDGPNYVEIFIDMAWMWNYTMHGPIWHNVTGQEPLQVTNITMDKANYTGMSLIRLLSDGRNLTMNVPSATATKIVVYTTYVKFAKIEAYGNTSVDMPSPGWEPPYVPYSGLLPNARMKVVYMHVESLFALEGLNVTLT